jgi:hypothetical protein
MLPVTGYMSNGGKGLYINLYMRGRGGGGDGSLEAPREKRRKIILHPLGPTTQEKK